MGFEHSMTTRLPVVRAIDERLALRHGRVMHDPLAFLLVGILRVAGLAVAALLAYFGYRLFMTVPTGHGDGEIKGLGVTVTLTRVGPGTFFALFSAAIVVGSFAYPIKITPKGLIGAAPLTASTPAIPLPSETGDENGEVAPEEAEFWRTALGVLLCLRQSNTIEETAAVAIDHGRVALMQRLWRPAWGEFAVFEVWALEGRGDPPVTAARETFNREDARCAS